MNIGSIAVGARALTTALSVTGTQGGVASPSVAPTAPGARSGPAASVLGALLGSASQVTAQRRAEQLGGLLTRLARTALSGATTGTKAATTTFSSSALGFLKDAKLSVDEKLARLMIYLSDKYEKQLEQKLQQYAALENGTAASSSTKKSSSASSGLGGLVSGLSSLVSKAGLGKVLSSGGLQKLVGQVAGPVLAGAATALGMPTLAPVLLKAGPLLAGVATGAVSALTDAAGSKAATTTTSSSSSSGSSASGTSEKALMTEIQILQEKQKEMFTLVSNILRAQHDTKMAVITNVR